MPSRNLLFVVALALSVASPLAQAQYAADKPVGTSAQQAAAWQKNAGIDQKLGGPLPLSDPWTDATGRTVKPGDFFHDNRPVMLALMY